MQVRPVEARLVHRSFVNGQLGEDVSPDSRVGGSGKGHQRHPWEQRPQLAQLGIFGPEIMPPERNAVSFIDGYQADVPQRQSQRKPRKQAFGAQVEQFQRTSFDAGHHPLGFDGILGAIEKIGRHAVGLQGAHLVFHQSH